MFNSSKEQYLNKKINDSMNSANKEKIKKLEKLGFQFDIDHNGYIVKYQGVFVHGAKVLNPNKNGNSKRAQAYIQDNISMAVSMAEQYAKTNEIEIQ